MVKLKLFIADDHAVLRSGLKLLLNAQPDFEVIGEAADGEEVIELCGQLKPDIVLLDLSMPSRGGLETLQALKEICPGTKVLVLTMYDHEGYLRQVLKAGGEGYILKKAADVELLSAIRAVSRGEIYVDSSLTKALLKGLYAGQVSQEDFKHENLSSREKEILQMIALGYTNQQVAQQLMISIKTVESHKAHIKEKLNLKRRSDLVSYAISTGLLPEKL